MRKKVVSIALAGALATGVAAPAAATAAESTEGPNMDAGTFVHSVETLGAGFINDPVNVGIGVLGSLLFMPVVLSSWIGIDLIPKPS